MHELKLLIIAVFAFNAFGQDEVTIWYEPLTLVHATNTDSINIESRAIYKLDIHSAGDVDRIAQTLACYHQSKTNSDIRMKIRILKNREKTDICLSRFHFVSGALQENCLSAKFLYELLALYLPDRFKSDYKTINKTVK
jgi:hypothetical protein